MAKPSIGWGSRLTGVLERLAAARVALLSEEDHVREGLAGALRGRLGTRAPDWLDDAAITFPLIGALVGSIVLCGLLATALTGNLWLLGAVGWLTLLLVVLCGGHWRRTFLLHAAHDPERATLAIAWILIGAGLCVFGIVVPTLDRSPAALLARPVGPVHFHVVGVRTTSAPAATGGTLLSTQVDLVNDGPDAHVKHVDVVLVGPTRRQLAEHVNLVTEARAAAADFTDLDQAPEFDVPRGNAVHFTATSVPLAPDFYAAYISGKVNLLLETRFYVKTSGSYGLAQEFCLRTTGTSKSYTDCPSR